MKPRFSIPIHLPLAVPRARGNAGGLTVLFLLSSALLLTRPTASRADLTHSWDSPSALPATLGTQPLSPSEDTEDTDSADSPETPAPTAPTLDSQIADLLSDDALSSPSPAPQDLSTLTVPVSDTDLLLDRLAVLATADVPDDTPETTSPSAPVGAAAAPSSSGTDLIATRVSSAFATHGSAPSATTTFTASDKAENYDGNWALGDNHGTGFDVWRQVAPAELPSRSVDDQGFAIYAQSGVGVEAIGRSFADGTALESGTFKVSATHDSSEHFSGFAIYGAGDAEIFRWGLATAEDRESGGDATGFWYFRDGQSTLIRTIDAGEPLAADYSISWSVLASGMSIDLSIASSPYDDTLHLTLDTSSAVTAVAALVAGSTQAETLHFDNLEVTGRAVPEPATLALLLLGALALRPRRT